MLLEEFSNQFDLLVSSYMRFRNFDDKEPIDTIEFDEYEKSFYLTKAQEELVRNLYNGENPFNDSFEKTEEMRRYLSPLIEEAELNPITTSNGKPLGVDSKSKFFSLPQDLWFITFETVGTTDNECMAFEKQDVYPVRQDEYHKIKKNPFRGPNKRRALRLDLSDNVVEIISTKNVGAYYIRYIKKLEPIVLEDMPNGASIEGVTEKTPCKLHESLHQKILELAVLTALRSKRVERDK